MSERRCRRCHCPFYESEVDAFFRRTSTQRSLRTQRMAVCIGCELTARTDAKVENRWRVKAKRTFDHHVAKFVAAGVAPDRLTFVERFGWDVDQMAHDAEHAHSNGCPYCFRPFAEMANGPRDVTLDIVDPEAKPYYQTNVRWCCATCNTEKQRTPPELWGAKLAAWRRWRKWTASEYPPDSLFGDWAF